MHSSDFAPFRFPKATALVVASTIGEDWSLLPREHKELVRIAVATARGVPIIAGANSNATARAIALARTAQDAGADAVISIVPYYNKPTQDGIFEHFRALASSIHLPVILSDNPPRCLSQLADATIVRLAADPRFIGLEDGSGDLTRADRLKTQIGRPFRVFCGDDANALPYLMSGGDGCISMTSNVIPSLCREMFLAYKRGHFGRAQRLAMPIAELTESLSCETNPAPLKYALSLLDFGSARVRLPLVEATIATKAKIGRILYQVYDSHNALKDTKCPKYCIAT